MKHNEHIVAVPACAVSHEGEGLALVQSELKSKDVVIGHRAGLEVNPDFRQLIPYVMIRCNGKVLAYRRNKLGNESRLYGNVSIGFGGHIDINDVCFDEKGVVSLDATLQKAAERELNEEIDLGADSNVLSMERWDKVIISNLSDVDRVHLGIVIVIEVSHENVSTKEAQLESLGFLAPDEIKALSPLENWTEGLLAFI